MSRNLKKKGKKKAPTTKALAERIHKLEKSPELKFHDSSFGPSGIVGTGIAWNSICLIPQGDDVEQRSGNKITTKYLTIRAEFQGLSTSLADRFCRIIVFWDSAPNGASPVVSDANVATQALLDANGATLSPFFSYRNLRTGKRYKILSDTIHKLEPKVVNTFNVATGATVTVVPSYAFMTKTMRLGRVVSYLGGSNAITDLSQNGLFVAFLQDGATAFANVFGTSRLAYTDD